MGYGRGRSTESASLTDSYVNILCYRADIVANDSQQDLVRLSRVKASELLSTRIDSAAFRVPGDKNEVIERVGWIEPLQESARAAWSGGDITDW